MTHEHTWTRWHAQRNGTTRRWCRPCGTAESRPRGDCPHAWQASRAADAAPELWIVERRCDRCQTYERVEIPEWVAATIYDAALEDHTGPLRPDQLPDH